MTVRHCAKQGCIGTLPAGRGKYCPRCGGTEFLPARPTRRRGGRAFLILLIAFGIGAIVLHAKRASVSTIERRRLEDAHEAAANMTETALRDDAYARILHQALAQHDFEYACQLGSEMTGTQDRDRCLLETVDAALKAQQPDWAKAAANEIVETSVRDDAFGRIMEANPLK